MVALVIRRGAGLALWLALFGAATIAVAIGWWAILFPAVVENTGLSLSEALPCIASRSDICSLAMALCGARHLFGIREYSPSLFWAGIALLSASLLVASRPAGKRRD
jgi:hypothetical protein